MTKKKAPKVEAVQEERTTRPVRLDLSEADPDRLATQARKLGLSKSSHAIIYVFYSIKAENYNS